MGAGLAGLSAADALHRRGIGPITVFERAEGPGRATSFANGALLHPSLVEPWNSPGVLGQLLRNLGREDAAALLRLRALPTLLVWGLRFVRESTPPRYRSNTRANLALARHSVALMAGQRDRGLAYEHHPSGSLMLFRDRRALDAATAWAEGLAPDGRRVERLSPAAALAREPALAPIGDELVGALYNPDDERGDAHRYCTALADSLAGQGVEIRLGCSVAPLRARHGRVDGVEVDGERLAFDDVVLAAASWSPALATPLGLDLPIRPAKGYSLTLQLRPDDEHPVTAVVDADLHVAVVPVGSDHLRIAGTAEFAGHDLRLNDARVANLARLLGRVYPRQAAAATPERLSPWTALRPMTPDGRPLIGATRIPGLWLNTGHGHLGWTLAAGSADLLADLMTGRPPGLRPEAYAPARWGL